MMKLFLVAFVVTTIVAADLDTEWFVFKTKYYKEYSPEVDTIRKYIWSENKKLIEEHNKKFRRGLSSYYLGENEYADMTYSEFVSKMAMTGLEANSDHAPGKVSERNVTSLPASADWTAKGYVTPVKNQVPRSIPCRSSWAFSATGAMEGQHFKATGKLVSLSESNLIDCSKAYGSKGCKGGTPIEAFEYIIANKGIDTESSYPYVPKDSSPCMFNRSNVGATFSNYTRIASGSEVALQQAVAKLGPISVGIDNQHVSFLQYKGGVYDEPSCRSTNLSHYALVVGYGTYQGHDYWLVKNSWGTSWGDRGYIKMSRNKNNQCGIATTASYPVV